MERAAPLITKHRLETNLIEKCWRDPEFRAEVMKDPKGMLEVFLGWSLPPNFEVIVRQDDAQTLHFAIPPPPGDSAELSDAELERVAGGTEVWIAGAAATVSAIVAATVSVEVKGSQW